MRTGDKVYPVTEQFSISFIERVKSARIYLSFTRDYDTQSITCCSLRRRWQLQPDLREIRALLHASLCRRSSQPLAQTNFRRIEVNEGKPAVKLLRRVRLPILRHRCSITPVVHSAGKARRGVSPCCHNCKVADAAGLQFREVPLNGLEGCIHVNEAGWGENNVIENCGMQRLCNAMNSLDCVSNEETEAAEPVSSSCGLCTPAYNLYSNNQADKRSLLTNEYCCGTQASSLLSLKLIPSSPINERDTDPDIYCESGACVYGDCGGSSEG